MHAQPCFCPVCVPERTAGARILVCGGRHFDNWVAVSRAMDHLDQRRPIGLLIHGDAPGADRTAAQWAVKHRVPIRCYPADWDRYGPRAGPLRNARMLEERPDGVVAFPGGRGTADMCRQAEAAGIRIWRPFG